MKTDGHFTCAEHEKLNTGNSAASSLRLPE
jgi:hypothetical protein